MPRGPASSRLRGHAPRVAPARSPDLVQIAQLLGASLLRIARFVASVTQPQPNDDHGDACRLRADFVRFRPTPDRAEAETTVVRSSTLYEPSTEHDSCGFGFVADIAGNTSHAIVRDALTVLANLEHRGASGSEKNTGDGAGILLKVPYRFLGAVAAEDGLELPDGGYGV